METEMLNNNIVKIECSLFAEDFDFSDIVQRFEKDVMPLFESRDKMILKQMMRMLQDDNSLFCYYYHPNGYYKSTRIVIEDGEESEKRWSFQFSFDSSLFVSGFGGFLLDNDEVYHRFSMANDKSEITSSIFICNCMSGIDYNITYNKLTNQKTVKKYEDEDEEKYQL